MNQNIFTKFVQMASILNIFGKVIPFVVARTTKLESKYQKKRNVFKK